MAQNLTCLISYTQNSGDDPATGLTLADIDLYLTAVNRSTGARTVIWDGTQNPTFEVDNVGAYGKVYTSADLDTYDYVLAGNYTGGSTLDNDWVTGAASLSDAAISEITGASDIPATPTLRQAIMLLYMWLRNNSQATATERRVFNNAGTEILDATMSDDGTTFSQGQLGDA